MLATENLTKEHQLILKYVNLMERYAESTLKHQDNLILMEKADCFLEFIDAFADRFHHEKEESILFRYLQIPGVLTHCNPVPQMLNEHQKAREFVQSMRQALQAKDLNGLANNAVQYSLLLKEHIYKEDNILYPMAERSLSGEVKLKLSEECCQADECLDSQTIWCKYERLYNDLEHHHNLSSPNCDLLMPEISI